MGESGVSKAPRTRTVHIPFDDQACDRLEQARDDLQDARTKADATRSSRIAAHRAQGLASVEAAALVEQEDQQAQGTLLQQAAEAAEKVLASMRPFRFEALGRKEYRALVTEHATDKKPDPAGDGNEEFARALIQASCVKPKLSDDEMADMFDGRGWNPGEISWLFAAAYEVCTKRRVVEL